MRRCHSQFSRYAAICTVMVLPYCRVAAQDAGDPDNGLDRAPTTPSPTDPAPIVAPDQPKKGLLLNGDGAMNGYTLFAPLDSTTTYLVDLKGEVAHKWESKYSPGQSVYLQPDGSLLRCAREPNNRQFSGGGIGGRVERLAPDGKVLWEYVCADDKRCQHHDIEPLPNGNILMIAWEKKTRDEAIAAGRDPKLQEGDQLWPDCVLEVRPQGDRGGEIVWEWHIWDHLVQEIDKSKANYGVVADHPELVDLNYRQAGPRETPADLRRLRGLGYIGGGDEDDDGERYDRRPPAREREDRPPGDDANRSSDANQPRPGGDGGAGGPPMFGRGRGPGGMDMRADLFHTNAIAYNARLDQILLSIHNYNEIWIIDHGTTTQQATGHSGGRYGKGGDLLYRWGTPRAYGAGGHDDQQLFAQHDAHWIADGLPGAGRIMIFNNGMGRRDGQYSSVVEIEAPVDPSGRYLHETHKPFGPSLPSWEYVAEKKTDFFSSHISGAQRLKNGNTLICSGEAGRIFEVNHESRIVWDYVNPFQSTRGPRGGPPGGFRGPPGEWDGGPPGPPLGAPGPMNPSAEGRRSPQSADNSTDSRDQAGAPTPTDGENARRQGQREDPPPRGDSLSNGSGERLPRSGFGGPPGGFGGPPGGGGLFRATRIAADDPALAKILAGSPKPDANN